MSQSINNEFQLRRQKLGQLKLLRNRGGKVPSDTDAERDVICNSCGAGHFLRDLKKLYYVCPECGYHFRISPKARFEMLFDGDYELLFENIEPEDPIAFPGYAEKLALLRQNTGIKDACVSALGEIGGYKSVACALSADFLMGSMGTAVGEKISRSAEFAGDEKVPIVIFSASGGARMQEGIFSLMQMAKTSAVLKRFSDNGGLYISCLTNPTTGGVTASFASLGDIIIAEPDALIGFAGPRVIEQTIKAKLPKGFQRSQFQLEHGFADAVIPRGDMKETLTRLFRLHAHRGNNRQGDK